MSHFAADLGPYFLAVLVATVLFAVLRPKAGEPASHRQEPPMWVKGLCLSLAVGAVTYLFGLMAGSSLQAEETCVSESGRAPDTRLESIDRGYLPLTNTCEWADGSTYEMVPGWVNPALLGCAAFAALCLSIPVRAVKARTGGRPG
ncbi:hypothetical protein [Streptomyces sp. AS58]|uniref:hypothetical protein n=1 Tax=Streptomyces sp. AS58 TaxID=1519489 RepID=UPI0006AD8D63|nr:hypothetical protein [Streptomyces sp. AS58]